MFSDFCSSFIIRFVACRDHILPLDPFYVFFIFVDREGYDSTLPLVFPILFTLVILLLSSSSSTSCSFSFYYLNLLSPPFCSCSYFPFSFCFSSFSSYQNIVSLFLFLLTLLRISRHPPSFQILITHCYNSLLFFLLLLLLPPPSCSSSCSSSCY